MSLKINQLCVEVADKQVVNELSLEIPKGEVHAIMGPNGTGKSSFAKAIAGHEDYQITSGSVELDGKNIIGLEPDEISKDGLFLAFQYPMEIPGVSIANFLRAAVQSRLPKGQQVVAVEYYKKLYAMMQKLEIDKKFSARSVNEGFSGGEKKRCEILQMMMLEPSYVIMDETDSGLDIDALKVVSDGVNMMRGADRGFLVITHYQRLLNYIVPDVVHVMYDGRIVKSGDKTLALELEEKGYDWIKEEAAATANN